MCGPFLVFDMRENQFGGEEDDRVSWKRRLHDRLQRGIIIAKGYYTK